MKSNENPITINDNFNGQTYADYGISPYAKKHDPIEITDLLKYFLHGLAFSVLMFGIIIGWVFILAFLMTIGSIIGLILGLVLLVYFIGYLNSYLTAKIWFREDPVTGGFIMTAIRGTILLVVLIIVSVPRLVIGWLTQDVMIAIAVFVAYCFIYGYFARYTEEMN